MNLTNAQKAEIEAKWEAGGAPNQIAHEVLKDASPRAVALVKAHLRTAEGLTRAATPQPNDLRRTMPEGGMKRPPGA